MNHDSAANVFMQLTWRIQDRKRKPNRTPQTRLKQQHHCRPGVPEAQQPRKSLLPVLKLRKNGCTEFRGFVELAGSFEFSVQSRGGLPGSLRAPKNRLEWNCSEV